MKRTAALIAASTISLAGLALTPPAAHAAVDRRPCVSQAEFGQVKKGMSRTKVTSIFDSAGKRQAISSGGGFTFEIRSYKACTQFGSVSIGYENGRLSSKAAVF